ncbi:MAG: hypothetical protein HYY01_08480 [Chloroflexi bacterium]|nr:hypothetical protein [Chloroflexota bacterium]
MNRFPASLPRRMYWSKKAGGTSACPECHGMLEPEDHAYLLAVRQRVNIESYVVGPKGGHFCSKCPVVVLDDDAFGELAALSMRSSRDIQFVVLGLVDLDAVPEEKRHLRFGGDNNPIPLVKFTNIGQGQGTDKR